MTAHATPRIALYDNTVNAAYVTAKLLRRDGYTTDLLLDDAAPFNQQPFWEDGDCALPASTAAATQPARFWRRLEEKAGYEPPSWIRGTRTPMERLRSIASTIRSVAPHGPAALAVALRAGGPVAELAAYDAVIVLGPSALVALAAGRPYLVMTMGWDVRVLPFQTGARSPFARARARLQRRALGGARAILALPSHDRPYLERLGLLASMRPFPIPVDIDTYEQVRPDSRAAVFGDEIARRADGKLLVLSPSRIDFSLKGHDRLLHGVARALADGQRLHLVALGWGPDAAAARALAADLGIADAVTILPKVLSKIRLVRAMLAADVVADQFVLPAYGTIAREALACGRPVIASYDPGAPQPHPPDDPAPIQSATDPVQIAAALARLASPALRSELAASGKAWARRIHVEASLATLRRELEALT